MPLMFDSIIFDLNPYFGHSATFAFILYEFAMLLDVYILLSPQEEEMLSSSGNRCTHLVAHLSKILNPLSAIILVCLSNA